MNLLRLAPAACLLAAGLTVSAAPSLTTHERRYDADEPVVFTLDNDSANVLGWGSFGRHPVISRLLPSGKRETVYGLPDAMDEGAAMLAAGGEAQWVWHQTERGDGEDDPGNVDDGDAADDAGIAVGEPNPNGDPRPEPTPMRGEGSHVGRGVYVAEFETFEKVYASDEFEIRGSLAVDPVGKVAVTWAALKARR
jgi:hypothetical protein